MRATAPNLEPISRLSMVFPFRTQPAEFLARPNRFRIVVRLQSDGQIVDAHCPNPGRMSELMVPGATVHLSRANSTMRKTAYDLRFVEHPEHGQLISLNTHLPNAIFSEGLRDGFFTQFQGYHVLQPEAIVPHDGSSGITSRIDYRLLDAHGCSCWVELKSVTLVEKRHAVFPDAPTARGRRHLLDLAALAQAGDRAAVLFIVQRPDADRLSPNWSTDPEFGQALVDARHQGVEVYAYTCHLTTRWIRLAQEIPVILCPPPYSSS